MLNANVWRRMVGVDRATVIEEIVFDEAADTVVVHVRPRRSTRRRCGRCGTRAPGYDQGQGRRNWRAVDLGGMRCFLQSAAVRVDCPTHGPTVAEVPWARHDAGHTRDFDDSVAWLAVQTSKTAVTELMRIAWRSVGAIITRVSAASTPGSTASRASGASGSTRSPTSAGTASSPWSSTTTPGAWSGRRREGTWPP